MTLLTKDPDSDSYEAMIGTTHIEVESGTFDTTWDTLARDYFDHGMSWDEAHTRALTELMQSDAWMSPALDGVRITYAYGPHRVNCFSENPLEMFQANIEQLVREGQITREPIWNQGIAVKYMLDEYQPIALAELDRQGK